MITITPGYTFEGGDVVTKTRLNGAITNMQMKAPPLRLLGTQAATGGETEKPVVDIPITAETLAFLMATSPETMPASFWQMLYPVGAKYENFASGTLPAHLAAIGTWTKLQGVVTIAVSATDADFAQGKTGGEKAVTLTRAQLPAAGIEIAEQTLQMDPVAAHTHPLQGAIVLGNGPGTYYPDKDVAFADLNRRGGEPKTGNTTAAAGGHTPSGKAPAHQTENLGSGQAHNNLPPYVTAHTWVRTA